jgi:uncharacterized protein (UPF0276 family)
MIHGISLLSIGSWDDWNLEQAQTTKILLKDLVIMNWTST